jgi:hypothetical protein
MAFVEAWVETDPDGAVITGSLLDDYQRQSKRAIRERLEGDASNQLSGIFQAGTFGASSTIRIGTARAAMVTFANLGTLTLADGRLAITSDTKRLYHLKASGLVEIAYQVLNTDGTVDGAGYHINANGTYASAKLYKDAVNGTILTGTTGSTYDLVLANNSGAAVIRILTGTLNVSMPGSLSTVSHDVSSSMTTPIILSPGASATTGWMRVRNGDKLAWRNAANSGDIVGIGMTGTALVLTGEASITLSQDTLVSGYVQATGFKASGTIATTGTIRLANGQTINYRNNGNTADLAVLGSTGVITSLNGETSINLNISGVTYASLSTAGLVATAVTTSDDQTQKLTIGRYSAGIQDSYIKIGASSTGLRITNAANTVDVMVLTNAGTVTFSGDVSGINVVATTGMASPKYNTTGNAAATTAGQLSIGGNSSTTASTYGGGGVSALPAQPLGYLPWFFGATQIKIPYYNA